VDSAHPPQGGDIKVGINCFLLDKPCRFRYICIRMDYLIKKTIQILAQEVQSHGSPFKQNNACYVSAPVDCDFALISI
jgi:hypothetical protein